MRYPNGKYNFYSNITDLFIGAIRLTNVTIAICDFCFSSAQVGYKTQSNDVFYCCEKHQ